MDDGLNDAILNCVERFVDAHRYPPTIREICEAVGRSPATVHRRLRLLRESGLITFEQGSPRTLRVVDA